MNEPIESPTPDVPNAAAKADVPFMRTIKSYIKRAGRTTTGQTKALAELGPQFLVPYQAKMLSATELEALFAQPASVSGDFDPKNNKKDNKKIVLEIGFGMGDATAHIAKVLPDVNFLCCEVHEPGVGALLKRVGEENIQNIRICAHDAVEVMENMLPEQSLDGIHIFFPDPWHKTKHNKRRLIQTPFVAKLVKRLKPNGYLHCATDWEPYAQQILEVLSAEPLLCNPALTQHPELNGYAPKPDYRPLTKFEKRGLRLGHGVWDLVFHRHPA